MKLLTRLLLLLGLLAVTPVHAQAWGPDGEQTPTYPDIDNFTQEQTLIDRTAPQIGDGSNAWGGDPPAYALQPAAVDNPVVFANGLNGTANITDSSEAKFRTVCGPGYLGHYDPIRQFGVKPYGHMHMFYGAANQTESATYATLRAETGQATCPGNGLNNSLYWAPAIYKDNALGDGITRAKKFDDVILYYQQQGALAYKNQYNMFPRGQKYIAGMNMDDPGDETGTHKGMPSYVKNELIAANAASTYAVWQGTNQQVLWTCVSSGLQARFLATSAGVDALGNCPTNSKITAQIDAPTCFDGKNLTSPDGYRQTRYHWTETGHAVTDICPIGWYKYPGIVVKFEFSHQGAADYTTWYASSDAAASAMAGWTMGHGQSLHVDWMHGWDQRAVDLWGPNCTATRGGTYWGACNDSSLASTGERLDSRQVVTGTYNGTLEAHWWTLPATNKGRWRIRR